MPAVNRNPPTPGISRRERARLTRLRIVRAAHELFSEHGYAGTRMTDVATGAGVAVQTVYFTFHTKSDLLQACYERAVLGEQDPRPPQAQPFYTAIMQAATGEEALASFAAGNSAIAARVALLDDVIRGAIHEPEAVAVRDRSEQLRRDGYRDIVISVERRFGLATGLDAESATDILLTLGGGSTYRQLVHEYGWSHERFVPWLAQTLAQSLLAHSCEIPPQGDGGCHQADEGRVSK